MLPPDEVTAAAGTAVVTGDLGGFEKVVARDVERLVVEAETAGSVADVHVAIDDLVAFYNTLSELHTQLQAHITQAQNELQRIQSAFGKCSVPGVRTVLNNILEAAGVGGGRSSLTANLQLVDHSVLTFMQNIQHNAQAYAAQENLAIQGFYAKSVDPDEVGSAPAAGVDTTPVTSSRATSTRADSGNEVHAVAGVGAAAT